MISDITFNGIMTVHSSFGYIRNRKEVENAIQLTRTLYPSPNNDYYCEEYSFTNAGEHPVTMRVPEWKVTYNTPERLEFMVLIPLKLLFQRTELSQ